MSYVHRAVIITAAKAARAAELCFKLAGPPGSRMFETPLSASGTGTATHYISSGPIEEQFAAVLKDPALMHGACTAAGISITLAECTALLAAADISSEPPFVALARMGLKLKQESV